MRQLRRFIELCPLSYDHCSFYKIWWKNLSLTHHWLSKSLYDLRKRIDRVYVKFMATLPYRRPRSLNRPMITTIVRPELNMYYTIKGVKVQFRSPSELLMVMLVIQWFWRWSWLIISIYPPPESTRLSIDKTRRFFRVEWSEAPMKHSFILNSFIY